MQHEQVSRSEGQQTFVKYSIEKIPVGQLPSGERVFVHKHEFVGDLKGPRIYIQANIHGPEVTGIPVIFKLIENLKTQHELYGSISLVPTANPMGLDIKIGGNNVGYTNMRRQNGQNWNRTGDYTSEVLTGLVQQLKNLDFNEASSLFANAYLERITKTLSTSRRDNTASTEQLLSMNLQRLSFGHDIFIDIHTAGNNLEHVYCFPHSVDIARKIGFKYVVACEESVGYFQDGFMLPNIELWKLLGNDYPSDKLYKHAFTVEFSGKMFDEPYLSFATQRVLDLLKGLGTIGGDITVNNEQFLVKDINISRYCSPRGGILIPVSNVGDTVIKGQTIALVQEITTGKIWPVQATKNGDIYTYPLGQVVDMGEPIIGIFGLPLKMPALRVK